MYMTNYNDAVNAEIEEFQQRLNKMISEFVSIAHYTHPKLIKYDFTFGLHESNRDFHITREDVYGQQR